MARNGPHRRRKRSQQRDAPAGNPLAGLDPVIAGYATVFVDLLGMSQELRRFDGLAGGPNPDRAVEVVRRTAMAIVLFRKHFHQYLQFFYGREVRALPSDLPAGAQGIWREFHGGPRPLVQGFGDSVAISVRLDYTNRLAMVRGIYAQFHATAGASLNMAYTLGQFLRGGVALGYGCVLDGKEVIGAGIAKAVKLEKDACFPRVRVDQEVIDFLGTPVPVRGDEEGDDRIRLELEIWLRQRCFGLLQKEGAEWYIDMLHPEACEGWLPIGQVLDGLETQARDQRARALQSGMAQEDREKVAKKYDWVLEQVDLARGRMTVAKEVPAP